MHPVIKFYIIAFTGLMLACALVVLIGCSSPEDKEPWKVPQQECGDFFPCKPGPTQ